MNVRQINNFLFMLPFSAAYLIVGFVFLTTDVGIPEPTSLSAILISNTALALTAPITSMYGAVLGSRLSSLSQLHMQSPRKTTNLLNFQMLGPTFLLVGLSHFVLSLLSINSFASAFNFEFLAFFEGLLILWFALMWGLLLGTRYSIKFSAPISLVSTYLFLVLPITSSYTSWRHLVGLRHTCCRIDLVVAQNVQVATLGFYFTLILGLALLAFQRKINKSLTVLLAAVFILTSTVVGTSTIPKHGFDAVQDRPTSQLICESNGVVEICVWPELVESLGKLVNESKSGFEELSSTGLRLPEKFVTSSNVDLNQASFRLSLRATPELQLASLLTGLVPEPTDNCLTKNFDALRVSQLSKALVLHLAGTRFHLELSEKVWKSEFRSLKQESEATQVRFIEESSVAIRNCSN
ncbi:MAG: hypothetical protein RL038_360 [Actinomycetota bacterium]